MSVFRKMDILYGMVYFLVVVSVFVLAGAVTGYLALFVMIHVFQQEYRERHTNKILMDMALLLKHLGERL